MKLFKKGIIVAVYGIFFSIVGIACLSSVSYAEENAGDGYEKILNNTTSSIKKHLEPAPTGNTLSGGKGIQKFLIKKIIDIVIPIAIAIGVVFAIIGFYRVMFSDSAESTKTGGKYILYGVIGIIIMMSARYLTEVITYNILKEGGNEFETFNSSLIADQLYSQVAYPFLKLAFYIIMGILFVVLVGQLFKYLFSTDDKIKKSAVTIISWNIIGLLVIIGSKQLIEVVYGSKSDVLTRNGGNLSNIGDAVLHTKDIPILYSVINWVMGLTTLIVLIIIIAQSYALLTKPDNADQFSRIKKSLLYIIIGIIVIGAGYLITNFLIIN